MSAPATTVSSFNSHLSKIKNLSREESNELFFYFYNINEMNPKDFSRKWDQIPHANFQGKQLAQILYALATHLKDPQINDDARGKILKYLRENIGIWEETALKKIHSFNEQGITNSLWSLAVIDSLYKRDSLVAAYQKVNNGHPPLNIRNAINLSQNRQADLWFTGSTAIDEPQNHNWNRKSKLEISVRDVFKRIGYVILSDSQPAIPQMGQAVDFRLHDGNTRRELWIEVDGDPHFTNPKQAKKPSDLIYKMHTYFQSALVKRLAAPESRILRIDVITASKIQIGSSLEASQLCHKLFDAATRAVPGVYTTTDKKLTITPMVSDRCFQNT